MGFGQTSTFRNDYCLVYFPRLSVWAILLRIRTKLMENKNPNPYDFLFHYASISIPRHSVLFALAKESPWCIVRHPHPIFKLLYCHIYILCRICIRLRIDECSFLHLQRMRRRIWTICSYICSLWCSEDMNF